MGSMRKKKVDVINAVLSLTPLMEMTLAFLSKQTRPRTANDIAWGLGYRTGQDFGRHSHNGRSMAPAQRVIHPLIGLRLRGLADYGRRPDGLSGTAYVITAKGREVVKNIAGDA